MAFRTADTNAANRSILIMIFYRAVGSERVPAGTTRSIMNSECSLVHASASRFVSKNRSTTMALSWLAVLPHRRAALRLTTAVPVSTAVQTDIGKNDLAAVRNSFRIDGAMSGAQTSPGAGE